MILFGHSQARFYDLHQDSRLFVNNCGSEHWNLREKCLKALSRLNPRGQMLMLQRCLSLANVAVQSNGPEQPVSAGEVVSPSSRNEGHCPTTARSAR